MAPPHVHCWTGAAAGRPRPASQSASAPAASAGPCCPNIDPLHALAVQHASAREARTRISAHTLTRQVPLIRVTEQFKGTQAGNVIFWLSIMLGQVTL
jgi:hypothetical protein